MNPVVVTLWIEDQPEICDDEMYAVAIERHLGLKVTDWTVEPET
jgi:hypothetical protein